MKPYTVWAVLGALALDAAAQQQSAATHPGDPAARVPQTSYRSAFEGYVPYREQALVPWREINDEVARIGGHAGIFRATVHGGHEHATVAKPAVGGGASHAGKDRDPVRARGTPDAPGSGGHGH
ncbi:MAG: hypothetical protein ACREUX_20820 [Burkholderiales bacterium]